MLVQQILKSKPQGEVVTIAPGASLAEAAELLSSRKIGAVVVSPDGKAVAGILSERDIVRELGQRGASCMADSVDDIMTAEIMTCTRGDTTDAVLNSMTDGRFRHMPVMEDGQMVGLISIGDVVKAQINELSNEKQALEGMIRGF
ncbi:MAG: CBS domain-containing protein [Nioella sp.]